MAEPVIIEPFLSDGGGDIEKGWLANLAQAWNDAGFNGLPSDPSLWIGAPLRYVDDGSGNIVLSTEGGPIDMRGEEIANVSASLVAADFTASALTIDASNAGLYRGRTLQANSSSPQTITIASSAGSGFNMIVDQKGTAQCTIAAGSPLVRRNRLGHTKTAGQYASVLLRVIGTDLKLTGDTAA